MKFGAVGFKANHLESGLPLIGHRKKGKLFPRTAQEAEGEIAYACRIFI